MAPEVYSGKYDYKVDLYSMGVILHQMLTGVIYRINQNKSASVEKANLKIKLQ
jgi:serine/threonine protein kinase